MKRARLRPALHAAVAAFLIGLAACAPPPPELPPAGGVPRFPDFIVPAVPAGTGTPAVVDRHKAAWLWLQAGDLRAAERNFAGALKGSPDFYPAEAGLGYVELAKKRPEAAVAHFDRAIVENPQYVPALVGRGEALLASGDRERALRSFEAAVAVDPDLATLRSRIEVLRFRGLQDDVAEARKAAESGRLDEARAAYERALAASPQSPFLLRELAVVERRAGNVNQAIQLAGKAIELEPSDARSLTLLGELHEHQGDFAKAIEAYEAAVAIEPNDGTESRLESLREKLLVAALPQEFHAIGSAPAVTRAQLAALLGVWLDDLIKRSPRRAPVLITDTRGSWAAPWILAVTRAGLMEVYPNHTFQPDASVRRSELAQAISRALALMARDSPALLQRWRAGRRRFQDMSQAHPAYPAVSLAVEAGVMQSVDDGSFHPGRPATGAEAVAAVRKLEELAESAGR